MQIKGFFIREIFRNHQNGYAVIVIRTEKKDITCAGCIQQLGYYTPVCLDGNFGINEQYPETFIIEKINNWGDNEQSDIQYLAHGLEIQGLTLKKAEKISKRLGEPIFQAIAKTSDSKTFIELFEEKDKEIARHIYTRVKQVVCMKELFDAIVAAGGCYSDAVRLEEKYGEDALRFMKNHPYTTGAFLDWNFKMCDQIAKDNGVTALSPKRAKGICRYAMEQSLNDGNTYASVHEFQKRAGYLMKGSALGEVPISYLISYLVTEKIYCVNYKNGQIHFSFQTIHDAEKTLVKNISRLLQSNSSRLNYDLSIIKKIEIEKGISFSDEQKNSFEAATSPGIKIVTGGPGCGKTTTIDGMIRYIQEAYNEEVCLCAPTGCAAQHMSENSGMEASTFHYLLGVRPFESGCTPDFNAGNQLPYKFFIMDEFSMADIEIVSLMFSAIPNDACVIIVGDAGQLESVGPGNVLEDFISSGLFEVYQLNAIFRQKQGSKIIDNAMKVAVGNSDLVTGADFSLQRFENETEAMQACVNYSTSKMDGVCQVLCPIKKDKVGTKYINKVIQGIRHRGERSAKVYGDYEFFVNDHVITIKNNREQGYFNGKPGQIKLIDEGGMLVRFENGEEIYIKNSALNEVIPAHALTIHKSQGSEYPEVAILLTETSKRMINRKTLYTAITRAKEKVSIFYQKGVLDSIPEAKKRHTELTDELLMLY